MHQAFRTSITVLALACSALTAGCGEDNAIDRLLDCQQICDRYQGCFDSDYDVDECRDSCESEADADADFEDQVDACERCIDGLSCTEGTFSCAADCIGIVP